MNGTALVLTLEMMGLWLLAGVLAAEALRRGLLAIGVGG